MSAAITEAPTTPLASESETVALEFLQILHPETDLSPRWLLIWTVTGETKRSQWFASVEAAADFAGRCNADAVYFGLGLAPRDLGPHKRCTSGEVAALPGLACDIDILSPVHNKPGLPPTIDDALRILPEQFPPTVVWSTGHGIQAAWCFKEAWEFTSSDERDRASALSVRWHNYLAGEAKRLGFTIDAVHDLARVLRLVGSTNNKVPDDPQPVRIIRNPGRRYDWTELEEICDFFGVAETELRGMDDSGRMNFGDLHLNPRGELDRELQQKLDALIENDGDFARTWNRQKRMPKDNSWSGFAQSIADVLAVAGFTDQEIIDVLSVHRREHGDPGKQGPKPLVWFIRYTLPKARKFASDQAAKAVAAQAKREKKAIDEAEERTAIASAEHASADEARSKIRSHYGLDVNRLIQLGNNSDPAFRMELRGGGQVEFPNLAAITSFYSFRRYLWLAVSRMLPGSAERKWPEVATLLGRLKEIEDVGGGSTEILLNYLGQWLSRGRQAERRFLRNASLAVYKPGPLKGDEVNSSFFGIAWAATAAEFLIGLKLLALPQGNLASIFAVCMPKPRPEDPDAIRVIFKLPPFLDHVRTLKNWTKDAEGVTKLLAGAGFKFRDTALVSTVVKEIGGVLQDPADNLRIRRTWAGWISDPVIEEHEFVQGRDREDASVSQRDRVQ